MSPSSSRNEASPTRLGAESWVLVERYVESYPDDWRCVFKRGDTVLEVTVPEEVWRAFDGILV